MSPLALLALATCLAWLYLLFLHGAFWRANVRLPKALPEPPYWPQVVAVIPARNEAESIQKVIRAHMDSDYPGIFSCVLVDDQSTDGTAERARRGAENAPDRLGIVRGQELREGWTGKMWAQAQGIEAARSFAPRAKYFLLCDADIELGRQCLRRLVSKAEAENLALTSLMSRLDARGLWASILVPAFILFFQKLYPFRRANDPASGIAAAAGGVMLVRADRLLALEIPHSIRGALIDDCALAKKVKNGPPRARIWIGLANSGEAVSLRDNRSIASIWTMVARTAFTQLRYSNLLLCLCLLGLAFIYLAAPIIGLTYAWHQDLAAFFLSLATWILISVAFYPTLRDYQKPIWCSPLLVFAGLIYGLMTFDSARRYWMGRGGQWKGRVYPGHTTK